MVELCNDIIKFKDIIVNTNDEIRNKEFLSDDCVKSVSLFHNDDDKIVYPYTINESIIPWKIIMWRVYCSI